MLNSFEKKIESIPTSEEVYLVFKELIKGNEVEELRKVDDEKMIVFMGNKNCREKRG